VVQSQNGDHPGAGGWNSGSRGPPDLDDVIRRAQEWFNRMRPGGRLGSVFGIAILVVVGIGLWTAYYTVPSDSVGVVQRFGKYLEEVPPGLHFKLPLGVDVATTVAVKRQLKQEFGFTTEGASDPYQSPIDATREMEMVTGDLAHQERFQHYPPEGKLRVYRSRGGGNEWEALTRGLPQSDCYVNVLRDAMAVDTLDECGIYFGTTGGQVYCSPDGGDNWVAVAENLPAVLSVEVQTLK
jgi:hypothetical protein